MTHLYSDLLFILINIACSVTNAWLNKKSSVHFLMPLLAAFSSNFVYFVEAVVLSFKVLRFAKPLISSIYNQPTV